MREPSVVLLSSWGSPELADYLAALRARNLPIRAVLCAGRVAEAQMRIVEERTTGFYRPSSIFEMPLADVAFYFVKSHNSDACLDLLRRLRSDLLVNAGTPDILKEAILGLPSVGILNAHPGILPKYRGCTCVEWAIYNDDPVGATCHFMARGIDEGPIVLSRTMPIAPGTPYEKVRADMVRHACAVMAEGVETVLAAKLSPASLPPQGEGTYHRVIPADALDEVRCKLAEGRYACKVG